MQPLVGFCVTSLSSTGKTQGESNKCLVPLLHCSGKSRAKTNAVLLVWLLQTDETKF